MRKLTSVILFVCLMLITLVVLNSPIAGVKSAAPLASSSLSRDLEPVIITGSQLPLFIGVDITELFGYTYSSGAWTQIPLQIDEVNADGEFEIEDGILDGNDELVFMSMDTAESVDLTQWINDADSQKYPRYQMKVTNPLDTSDQGWVYIYRSSSLTPPSTDYVIWNASNQRITGGTYIVGLNTIDFFGMDHLEVNGTGVDILDRSKVRINVTCLITILFNEENLPLSPDIIPDIDGPVRVGGGDALANIWAYHSNFNIDVGLDIDSLDSSGVCPWPLSLDINSVRVSLDLLDPSDSGMSPATYYDSNTAGGVIVNGTDDPDNVPTTPAKTWSQISGGLGSLVQLIDLSLGGGTISNYYLDDSDEDSGDTGDKKSFGDSGTRVDNPSGELVFRLQNFILPADQSNVGATYRGYKDNPLQVNFSDQTYDCKPYDVNISAPTSAVVGEQIKFEASVGKGLEPFTYEWDLGEDGSTGSGNPITYAYDDCADYQVSVKVSNTCGSADIAEHSIKIDGCTTYQEQYYLPVVSSSNP